MPVCHKPNPVSATMTMPSSLSCAVSKRTCQHSSGCKLTASYLLYDVDSDADRSLACGIHSRNRKRCPLIQAQLTDKQHRTTVNDAALSNRQARRKGSVVLRTNNRWNYSARVNGRIGVRLSKVACERGTAVLADLTFANVGPFCFPGLLCPSLAHMMDLCGLHKFEFNDKISNAFWDRLRKGMASPTSQSCLRRSERHLITKYAPGTEDASFYVNVTGSGNALLTPQQFRALVCALYEEKVRGHPCFAALEQARSDGFNLLLWTPEPIFHDSSPASLTEDFFARWKSFSAESVLACMLRISSSEDRPWNVYIRENHEIFYDD